MRLPHSGIFRLLLHFSHFQKSAHIAYFSPQKIGIFDGNFSYFNIFVFLFESAGLLNL